MAWPLVLVRDDRSGRRTGTMGRGRRRRQQRSSHESAGIMPADSGAQRFESTNGDDGAFLAGDADIDGLVDEVILNVHFVARRDDHVGAGGRDCPVGGGGLGRSDRILAQGEAALAATVGHTVSELGIAAELEYAELDVHRGLTGDGLAHFHIGLEVGLHRAVERYGRLAGVLAGATGQQGEGRENGDLGYVFHAKLLCISEPMKYPLRDQCIAWKKRRHPRSLFQSGASSNDGFVASRTQHREKAYKTSFCQVLAGSLRHLATSL